MAGSRYGLDFAVTGGAPEKLGKIDAALAMVGETAGKVAYGAGFALGTLEDKLSKLSKTDFASLGESLTKVGDRFSELSGRVTGALAGAGKEMIADAATFEDSQADLKFAFGDSWHNVFDQVLQDSAKLTFSFQDTVSLASGLGRLKINPFGGTDEASQKFLSKTGESVRALEILQDAADASGRDVSGFMFSLREAVSEDFKSIRDALDLPKSTTEAWKKSMQGLTTQQEKYNFLVKELGGLYGGAGALKSDNWNKTVAQLPDLLQQLRAGAGADAVLKESPIVAPGGAPGSLRLPERWLCATHTHVTSRPRQLTRERRCRR